jgi:flagellar hook assembly protein FlgD
VNPGPRTAVVVSASPNPFRPETAISFTTTRAGHVTATIYDVTGQRVRTLLDGTLEGGSHTLRWNGSTESGRPAASGAYFLKLHTPDGDGAKRLVLTK